LGVAAAINDNGQIAGASGICASFNPNSGLYMVENHALLWDRDGTPHDLRNLGGTGGIAGNHACALNNHGQVVGHSELPNDTTFHGFLWTAAKGMRDLGTLPGDSASLGLGINDGGEVVGASLDASFNPRAFLWESSGMADLNTLVTSNPGGLYLLLAESINSTSEIVGLGVTADGLHGFLATPNSRQNLSPVLQSDTRPVLTDAARRAVLRRLGIRVR
jgi:probable HAF family extracellular repeat protein